ncbi:hypothetical protein ACFU7C_25740, partial [Streptomyces bacillaris]
MSLPPGPPTGASRPRGGGLSARTADIGVAAAVTLLVVVWTVLTMRYESEPLNRTVIGWALIAVGCGARGPGAPPPGRWPGGTVGARVGITPGPRARGG